MKGKRIYSSLKTMLLVLPLFFITIILLAPLNAKAEGGVYVSSSNFPDQKFMKYVQTNYCVKKDGKDYLSEEKIKEITELSLVALNGTEYKSLKGIEYFTELKTLNCTFNPNLTSLDLSNNTKLETLLCYNTGLTSLNTSNNRELKELECQNCNISSLNLSNNTKLVKLNCRNNKLDSLDVTKNTNLKELLCHQNSISRLDLSANTELETLSCYNNKISTLDLRSNRKLVELNCYSNQLTSMDVTCCPKLERIYCDDNKLTTVYLDNNSELKELSIQNNKLENLYTNNNGKLEMLYAYGNPSLREIKLDVNGNLYKNIRLFKVTNKDDNTVTYSDNNNKIVLWKDKNASIVAIRATVNINTVDVDSVRNFVLRMYYTMLERDPEANGLDYYTTRLVNKQMKASDMARGFVLSEELKGYNYSNEVFVKKLYKTFLDRDPADSEVTYWVNELQNKRKTREFVLSGFVNSNEFQKICNDYGIERGTLVAKQEYESTNPSKDKPKVKVFIINTDNVKSESLDAYIDRLYQVILGRNADEDGKTYWRNQIIKGTNYDAVTAPRIGFFQSPEYLGKAVSDEQYIKDAYKSFLNRDPEPEGLEYWKNELATGKNYNRQTMLDVGFGNSVEYKQILESYGFGVTEDWR